MSAVPTKNIVSRSDVKNITCCKQEFLAPTEDEGLWKKNNAVNLLGSVPLKKITHS